MKKVAWKKVSQFQEPEESPGFLLWQVSMDWRRRIETVLATVGLTHAQFVLLAAVGWLTQHDRAITQVELARHCKMDITMTSQVLRILEKKRFIERKHLKGNERAKFPELTKKGAELIEKALPLVESIDEQFFKRISKVEFIEILQKLL